MAIVDRNYVTNNRVRQQPLATDVCKPTNQRSEWSGRQRTLDRLDCFKLEEAILLQERYAS